MKNHRSLLILALVIALLLSLAAMPALAEASTEEELAFVKQSVIDRCADDNTLFSLGDTLAVGNIMSFELTNLHFTKSDNGALSVYVYLTLRTTETYAEGIGLSDYDFMLADRPADVSDPAQFNYYYPTSVYGKMGNHMQPLAWPVYAYADEDISIILTYDVPIDATQFAFIDSNIMNFGDGLEVQGGIYSYSFYRHVADFNLTNSSKKTLAELYIIPADADDWGENILAQYNDPQLISGQWMAVSFLGSAYEDSAADMWDIKIVFDSGESTYFTKVPLTSIVDLDFHESDEEGRYTITY